MKWYKCYRWYRKDVSDYKSKVRRMIMRTIEIIRKLASPALIGGLGGLVSLGMVATAWGECVQNAPGASTVLNVSERFEKER